MSYQKLLGRYNKTIPITLFRCQSGPKTILREFLRQQANNLPSYDFRLMSDGLVHPMKTEFFIQPNGMSLRPIGKNLEKFLKTFRGKCIYLIEEGTKIPDDLILLHEHSDHYSLQTSVPCTENELNERLTLFLKNNGTAISKEKLFELIKKKKD